MRAQLETCAEDGGTCLLGVCTGSCEMSMGKLIGFVILPIILALCSVVACIKAAGGSKGGAGAVVVTQQPVGMALSPGQPAPQAPAVMAVYPGQPALPTTVAQAPSAPGVVMEPMAAPADMPPAEDLSAMTVKQLRDRAASVGVSANQIEDARDSDDPKGELIKLIVGQRAPAGPTRAELQVLDVKGLRTKATAAGVPDDAIEDARDSDDPKAALINLILSCNP
eukprot:COSAG02_NODE_1948_length_10297_cov_13.589429_2_plen_224_part_00